VLDAFDAVLSTCAYGMTAYAPSWPLPAAM